MLTIPTFRWMLPIFMLLWKIKADSQNVKVVCYYTNWSVYRPGTAKFNPQNINPYLCSHLIYAFGGFTKENNFKPFDKYQDIEKGGYAKFTGLKTYNKQLKTMLAIGGWNEGSSRFSPMVASPERRKEFVKNAIKFLRQNHFDGLDLDWEYPNFRDGGKPRDRENYALLVQGLREEFNREAEKTGRQRLLLTMAVPAGIEYIKKGYDLEKLNKYLDWMNILSYDYHSAFEPSVNHHAPLYSLEEDSEYNYDADLNIDHTIQHYLENGVEKEKLVLGIPTYGRSYTLFNPEANEIGAPADGPGDMGDATRENGYLAYYEICEKIKSEEWKVIQPNTDAMGPYAYKENQWVGYDDESIVKKKAEYVAENGLGGIMFWSIDNDDFRGNCRGKPYPLIETGKEALIAATSNAISSKKPSKGKPTIRNRKPIKKIEDNENSVVQNSGGRQNIETSTSHRRRINAISRQKKKENENETKRNTSKRRTETSDNRTSQKKKAGRRRPSTTTTGGPSPTYTSTTPKYFTPEPPPTPDSGSDFKCEDEGFFPHPRDCKKYFWCLSSGPSELGIVAHQFTCPSGLYFNKAADSCDYTQNVLCNIKKKAKAASTTTTTEPPTKASTTAYTTRRSSPTTTTTTAPPEYDEYEYEDDVIKDEEEVGSKHTEQDPKVIKELIQLIKKAGGIEELERHLKFEADGTANVKSSDLTTPSTISKSLYEKVLNRNSAAKNEKVKTNTIAYKLLNRNSRGPQNEDITKEQDNGSVYSKSTPKYTTIQRQRPSTEKTIEEEKPLEDDEDSEYEDEDILDEPLEKHPIGDTTESSPSRSTFGRINHPEYVTIKRSRPTTEGTTSSAVEKEEDENDKSFRGSTERTVSPKTSISTPEYVTVRRMRPSSTTETSTLEYVTIRGRSTTIPVEKSTRGSSVESQSENGSSSKTGANTTENTVSSVSESGNSIEDSNTINDSTDTVANKETLSSTTSSSEGNEKSSSTESSTTGVKDIPQLSEPTPFLLTRRSRPTTTSTTTITPKVSPNISSNRLRKRPLKIPSSRPTLDSSNEKSKASLNSLESSNEKTEQEKLEFESKNAFQRRRGGNRFKFQTSESVASESQNLSPNQVDTSDQVRTFRPDIAAELADLSSLTAADIAVPKGLRQNQRRRRPTTTFTTLSSSAEETAFRRLSSKTVEGKLDLNRENVGGNKLTRTDAPLPKRRRLASRNYEDNSDSSVSTSNTSIDRKPLDIANESISNVDSSKRNLRNRIYSRRTPTSTTPRNSPDDTEEVRQLRRAEEPDNLKSTPQLETLSTTKPRRKVIRRLLHRQRSTTALPEDVSPSSERNPTTEYTTVSTLPSTNTTNKIVGQITESTNSSSTENIINIDDRNLSKLEKDAEVTTINSTQLDNEAKNNNTEDPTNISDEEEEENIKLSETIISESKNDFFGVGVKDIGSLDKVLPAGDSGKESYRNTFAIDEDERIPETGRFNKRRKIVRKFSTTEFPTTAVSTSIDTFGQRTQPRKIIRRLRPQNRFDTLRLNQRSESSSEPTSSTNDAETTSKRYFKRPSLFLRNKQFDTEKKSSYSLEYLNRPSSTESTTKSDISRRYSRRPYSTSQRIAKQQSISTTPVTPLYVETTRGSVETTVEPSPESNTDLLFELNTESTPVTPISEDTINLSSTISLEDIFNVTVTNEPSTEVYTTENKEEYSTEFINLDASTISDRLETTTWSNIPLEDDKLKLVTENSDFVTNAPEISSSTIENYVELSTVDFEDESNTKKTDFGFIVDNEQVQTNISTKEKEEEGATTILPDVTTLEVDKSSINIASTTELSTTTTMSTTTSTLSATSTTSSTSATTKSHKNRLFVPNSLRPKLKLTQKSNPLFLKISDQDQSGEKIPQFKIYNSRYGGARKPATTSILNESRDDNDDENSSNHGREENDVEEENDEQIDNESNVAKEVLDDDAIKTLKSKSTQKPLRSGFKPSFTRRPLTGFKARTTTSSTERPPTSTANIIKALDARNKFLNNNSRKYKNPLHRPDQSSTENSTESHVTTTLSTTSNTLMTTLPINASTEGESTTLAYHHVFEENGNSATLPSQKLNETVATDPIKKSEKLIEVNRIVKVSLKEANQGSSEAKEVTLLPSVDKVGVISRVKVVNIVDGTKSLSEDPTVDDSHHATSQLSFDPNLLTEVATNKYLTDEIHIDSRSMVHTFTAKPPVKFESATISLEGLFNYRPFRETDKYSFDEEEALEADNSHRVTVRVIQPKAPVREEKKIDEYMFAHPMNIIHENGALRAKVIEVTPEFNAELIRIAPIAVSVGEKVSSSPISSHTPSEVVKQHFSATKT